VNRRVAKELSPEAAEKKSRYLYWWLLLALFFEYARPGSYFPVLAVLPLNAAIPSVLLLVTLFAGGLRPWGEIFRDKLAGWLIGYVVFILVSMAWAAVTTYAYARFNLVVGYLFLFIVITRIVTTAPRLRGVFVTLILAHVFLLWMNPLVVTEPTIRHYIIGATFLGDGNDYSLSLCILAPLAIELALRANSRMAKLAFWLLLVLILAALVGTQSRGATLGIAAVFIYLWLQSSRKAMGLVAIGGVALLVLLWAPQVYFSRLGTIANYQEESSAQSRISAWKAGFRMGTNNVLGVGAGNFPNNFPKYRDANAPVRWMTAHSMYFLTFGELGILGVIIIFKLLAGNIRANTRLRRRLQARDGPAGQQLSPNATTLNMLNASVIGLAVAGAFLSVSYYPHVFVLTGLLLSARAIIAAEEGIDLGSVEPARRGGLRRAAALARKAPASPESAPRSI
jgi:putative inorganic carbon (hco3(-)) transporter